ncbi:MAG TPA: mechanosensitive ion channel domain-containing protein [Alphaproteobacteria bacterium]|nr:mechanosensitive ion channel domain-containing protein [Alphaproteobacteria bacterium]
MCRKKTLGRRLMFAAALLAAAAVVPGLGQAWAADAGSNARAGAEVKTEDLESLLKTIEDPAERQKLASQLRAMIAAQKQAAPETGTPFFDALSEGVHTASQQIATAAQAIVDVPTLFNWVGRQATSPEARSAVIELAVKLLLVIGIAWLAQRVTATMLRRPRRAAEALGARGGLMRWGMRFAHVGLDIAPIMVFAAIAYTVLPFTNPDAATRAVAIAVVNAVVLVRLILVAASAVLSPDAAGLRLLPVNDETAHYVYLWVRRLTGTAVYGYFAAEAALVLGLHRGGFNAVLNALGLAVTLMLVILILQNRRFVADGIRGRRMNEGGAKINTLDSLRSLLADTWHVLAILYMAALFFVWALRVPGGFQFVLTASLLTVAIIVVARLATALLERAIDRGFSLRGDVKQRFPSLEARANRYLPVLKAVAKVVVYGLAALGLLQVWGLESLTWLTTGVGREIAGTVLGIAIVLMIATMIWEGATLYMESYTSRYAADPDSAEHYARIQTILPLFRKFLFMVLAAIVALVVLAQVGINIAPLLAGAGIVGLAVGFGAQKLVQDVLNGLFIYLEAAVAVGDIVDLGDHSGVVEAMSMRSIRLRDLEGNVHTIPFSAVTTVMNRTKGFSYYLFDMGVGYGEDVDRVIKVLQEIGAGMRKDKNFGPHILEEMEMLGLDKFGDSAVVIKGRIMTLPARQWLVGREFNRRVKKRFDELGIEIPFPQRTVHMRMPPGAAADADADSGETDDADLGQEASRQ